MATKKISELSTASSVQDTDLLIVESSEGTRAIAKSTIISDEEKTKLANIEPEANKYVLPVASDSAIGGIKSGEDINVDEEGNVTVVDDSHTHSNDTISSVDAAKITSGTIDAARLPVATATTAGAMSAEDKAKLDGLGDSGNSGYTYGTEDLVAGESLLESGKLYFVYE